MRIIVPWPRFQHTTGTKSLSGCRSRGGARISQGAMTDLSSFSVGIAALFFSDSTPWHPLCDPTSLMGPRDRVATPRQPRIRRLVAVGEIAPEADLASNLPHRRDNLQTGGDNLRSPAGASRGFSDANCITGELPASLPKSSLREACTQLST